MKITPIFLTSMAVLAGAQAGHRTANEAQRYGPNKPGSITHESGGPEGWSQDADHVSICDKYTTSILGENTAANQQLLMVLFVNTGMVGNYTTPNVGIEVPGVIWPANFHGKPIKQMPYFNGQIESSNVGVDKGHGVAINWLDGGGPEALRMNLTSFNQSSNQLFVLGLSDGCLQHC